MCQLHVVAPLFFLPTDLVNREVCKVAVSTDQIWREFGDRLRFFILRRVRSEHDAEDILQDVFSKIHNNFHTLKQGDKLEPWIYQIARNTIFDYYRHQGKAPWDISEMPEQEAEPVAAEDTPEEVVACLKPMIDDLPEKYRQAILLTEYEGLTQKEMSQRLGLSLSGAKSRVHRAREKLKGTLLACCHFEFDRLGNIIDYQPKEQTCRYCSKDKASL